MNQIKNLRELDTVLYKIGRLRKISCKLHHLDEVNCNYGLSKRQETREDNLEKRAEEIAETMGCKIYRQGDPRGCSLYLVDNTIDLEGGRYTDGIALC